MLPKVVICNRCGRSLPSSDRYCASCGDPLPQMINVHNTSQETPTSTFSSLDNDIDRIERMAKLVVGMTDRVARSFKNSDSDPKNASNRAESNSAMHYEQGKSEIAVKMFTIGAISVVLITTIIATGIWGISTKTIVPLATLVIIFAFAVWLVLLNRR